MTAPAAPIAPALKSAGPQLNLRRGEDPPGRARPLVSSPLASAPLPAPLLVAVAADFRKLGSVLTLRGRYRVWEEFDLKGLCELPAEKSRVLNWASICRA